LGSVPVIVARAAPGRALDTPASGAALVFVKDNDARLPPPDALLAAEFGLTWAEARIASALAGGESLQNIADTQGVSINTVRSLLKRAMAKAEASSQAAIGGEGALRRGVVAGMIC
jgi:DNA-binding CsgD family transcriptional regulator